MSELLSLPVFTFETPLRPSADRGHMGDLQWIAIDKLFIDRSYQRDIRCSGKGNIRKIAENFHWSLFSPLVVAPRENDRYAIIDGQHRATAAKMHGSIGSLPCLVVHASATEEAKAFAVINGNVTRLASHYIFRARLSAGEQGAGAAFRAAEAAGVRIMPYPVGAKELKPNETLAAGTIETCVAKYGEDVVRDSLLVIMSAAKGEQGLLAAALIAALCDVFYANPVWRRRRDEAADAIGKRGIRRLLNETKSNLGANSGARGQLVKIITALLTNALGAAPVQVQKTQRVIAREERRTEFAPKRTPSRPSSPAMVKPLKTQSEKDAIAAFVASHGVRKLDCTATGNTSNLLDWLSNVCKVKARRISSAQRPGAKVYEIGAKRYDLNGLLEIVDRERRKRGLEPIRRKAA